MIGRAESDEAARPRMVALPLGLAGETAVEAIAEELRGDLERAPWTA
jgi:hypothetical protein